MLIIFEGGEGVGKTTQIKKLYDAFKQQNFAVLKTREPGGTPFAEKIRDLFKEKTNDPPSPLTELYLISAARNEHVKNILLPNIKNHIILCDRFLDSTYVYQSFIGGLPKELIDEISKLVLHGIFPDITFFLDCAERITELRIQKEKGRMKDRFDSSNAEQRNRILSGYKEIYEKNYTYPEGKAPLRILIDAEQSIEDIFSQITKEIKKRFDKCHPAV